ncbi:MAG: fumarylacetoacetate hydrolase family protein [Muribaculaceae bacterium]|nr:fumarylacetoacetate hydrolase family protein [Muribaculaceae bacterium]
MKVIGISYNGDCNETKPPIYLMAESSVLRSGKPFFVPDFAERFIASAAIVVRISRLGKSIANRFADRYFDAVTIGLSVRAELVNGFEGRDCGSIANAFDGAAIVGDFPDIKDLDEIDALDFSYSATGVADVSGNISRHGIDDCIEYASRFFTLKMGDLIFITDSNSTLPLTKGNKIFGSLGGRNVLKIKIK